MALDLFLEVAGVLALAAVLSVIALALRQPLIVAFLVAGILAGPAALGIVRTVGPFELLAELGIVLVLFYVGMKLDPGMLRQLGRVALVVGTIQVVSTTLLGVAIAHALGFGLIASAYIGVGLSFSSTIVIVKLISDKREAETLHGRLAVGLLVVQDIWVIVVLVGLSLVGAGAEMEGGGLALDLLQVFLAGALLLFAVFVAMRWVFPRLLDSLARSRELLVLFAVAWGISLAAASQWAGLSAELGGFVAGVALSSSEYREAVASRIVSLRDFMLLFFFVILGASLDLASIRGLLVPVLVLSAFVFLVKPVLVLSLFAVAGFRRRTNFLCASMMGQISEFGLILGALGVSLGHIGENEAGLLTLVALLTIVLSTYVIMGNRGIYDRLRDRLGVFERRTASRGTGGPVPLAEEREQEDGEETEILVFGLGRFGEDLAVRLAEHGYVVKGIDLDPRAVARCRRNGVDAVYGDAEDPDFPLHLPVREARLAVSTIPQPRVNRVLRKALRAAGYEGRLIVTAHWDVDAATLKEDGFKDVLLPFREAAQEAARPMARLLGEPRRRDDG